MDIETIYHRHVDVVYRVCYSFMKTPADAEDATQDTFIKLMRASPRLADENHEKAWLIRTAGNVCKDMLRRHHRRNTELDDTLPAYTPAQDDTVLQAVFDLPERLKLSVVLHYVEGYTCAEIARMRRLPAATVRGHLHQARNLLKLQLEGELDLETR
ncbi:MAG: RNA polymerase sigma factor [Oscillospiraceae bacterium]|nr:RNA polymerase sigma factor [Oscillospiraceae bacterium]